MRYVVIRLEALNEIVCWVMSDERFEQLRREVITGELGAARIIGTSRSPIDLDTLALSELVTNGMAVVGD